jgi:branched-chain amino acid transport system permease protein
MASLVVSLVGGASLGGTYALIALGIVMAYRATGTFNFAHGEFMLLPAYIVGAWQASHTVNLALAIIFALGLVACIGSGFYVVALRRISGLNHFMGVIATFGLATILDGVMLIVFGSGQYAIRFPGLPTGATVIAGTRVSSESLVVAAFTIMLAAVIALVLQTTRPGRQVRVAGQDPVLASQSGINVRVIHMLSWAGAAALAGIAGIAYGSSNVIDTSMVQLGLSAFPAIVIGGMDSIVGAIVGGVIVGIVQGFVATYLNPSLENVFTYTLLLLVMLVVPEGIFGTRRAVRV